MTPWRPRERLLPPLGVLASLLLLCAAGAAEAEETRTIRAIELRGLRRLNVGEIESRMKLKVGQPYDAPELDREYERLWKTGEFLNIESPQVLPEGDGVRLIITFVERERIREVRIEGNQGLGTGRIQERLRTRVGGLLNPYDLRNDRTDLEALYRENGYLYAQVHEEQRTAEGGTVAIFRIEEGPLTWVEQIRFEGNSAFDTSELRDQMQTTTKSWFFGFPSPGYFDEGVYLADLERVNTWYIAHGYLEAKVFAEDFAVSFDRHKLYLGIRIEEGKRHRISGLDVEVQKPEIYSREFLLGKLEQRPGDYFDGEALRLDRKRLFDLYANNAYLDVKVEPQLTPALEGDEVLIRFRIREGEKIYIEGVEIRGNEETRDKVIRRELTFLPGEPVSLEKWNESKSNLVRLDYFQGAPRIFTEPSATAPNRRNVVVEVDEKQTGRILFGIGVTSGQGAAANVALLKQNFDWRDTPERFSEIPQSFWGGGQTLILEAQPGTELSTYRAEFINPRVLDSQNSLALRAYRNNFQRDDYEEKRIAGEIALGRRLFRDRRLRGEIAYRAELVDIGDIDADAPDDVKEAVGTTRISALRTELEFDKRIFRPIIGPIGGWSVELAYEYSGGFLGAELDMSKAIAEYSRTFLVYSDEELDRHLLRFETAFGWSEPHHNTDDVPIFERFYLGGSRTVRGFRFRGLGPHENQDPIGGSAEHWGSLQYSFPPSHELQDILRILAFADSGILAPELDGLRLRDYRLTLGGGLQLNLGIFGQNVPINLTWGEAVLIEDEDRRRIFLFDIGFRF